MSRLFFRKNPFSLKKIKKNKFFFKKLLTIQKKCCIIKVRKGKTPKKERKKKTMRTWRVWWNDETGRNHIVKVDATGIVPAIDEAQRKAMDKYGLEYLGWDLWKVEMV